MYGIDEKQFLTRIVVPVLTRIGLAEPNRIALVMGTCLKESLLKFVLQKPNGPALGFAQMEPITHNDIWRNWLQHRKQLAEKVRWLAGWYGNGIPPPEEMIGNANYAVAMAAVHYRRVVAPLPPKDPGLLCQYWKTHYNTPLGKGNVEEALPHFIKACEL